MDIPKRIIEEVAAKMLNNKVILEDIAIVPNIFLIYLHWDDYHQLKPIFRTLREQIIKRLNKEIAKEAKPKSKYLGKLTKIFNYIDGFDILGTDHQLLIPKQWDISFETTVNKIVVGEEAYQIDPEEICVIAGYSDNFDKSAEISSQLKTFVTIYKTDGSRAKNFVVNSTQMLLKNPYETNVIRNVNNNSDILATIQVKYNGSNEIETFQMKKDKITIGRETTSDIVLSKASDKISRRHLEISFKDSNFFLTSFGSFGTTLQGKTVPISDKDSVDTNIQTKLPPKARIALASGEVLIDFVRKI